MTREKKLKKRIVEGRRLVVHRPVMVREGHQYYYLYSGILEQILANYVFEVEGDVLINPEPYYTEGVTIE